MIRRIVRNLIEPEVKAWIKEALKAHQPGPTQDVSEKLAEMEKKQAKLEKRLGMAMGAIQAATTQIVDLKKSANQAAQAQQMATSASAMTESVADGLSSVEDQLAALMESMASNGKPAKKRKRSSS